MKNILFVCTGNTCRSSMAEAILKDIIKKSDEKYEVNIKSAGVFAMPGSPASRNAIEVLKEDNIDLSNHKSTVLTQYEIDEADLILTMTRSHKDLVLQMAPYAEDKIYMLNEYALDEIIDINDPYGGDVFIYRKSAEEIRSALLKVFEKLNK